MDPFPAPGRKALRAIRVNRYGGSDELRLDEAECPRPRRGEVLVRVEYAGVNFIDVYVRKGAYRSSRTYPNRPPFTPGMEGGGVVSALGEAVEELSVGDRVAWCLELGSYAEFATVPAWKCVPVPDHVDMALAVTLMLQGATAHYLASSLFPLERGHSSLVHAGAGGVGQLLVQAARLRGARVLSTVSTPEKADIVARLGAEPILYRDVDFAGEVLRATGDAGVDVVFDGVGQATFQGSLRCVKRRGTVALFGAASGAVDSVSPLDLAEAGSVFLTRPHLADYIQTAGERRQRAAELFRWMAEGALTVSIDTVFPLAQAKSAHDVIEAGKTRGKLLLKP